MQIELTDFWKSHPSDYNTNFKGDVSKHFLLDFAKQISEHQNLDIVISSVYKRDSVKSKLLNKIFSSESNKLKKRYSGGLWSKPKENSFNIWFTAENIRPPLDMNFDAYFSFDLDSFAGRNYYLPLWICRLGPTVEAANRAQLELTNERSAHGSRKRKFAVVASNPEPIRSYFIRKLQLNAEVDVFGGLGKPLANKDLVLRNYDFNVCFENDIYPGYVTEKAIEAYLSGCIPIWRGNDAGGYLNPHAIIDVSNLSMSDAIDKVISVSEDPKEVQKMNQAPLLVKTIPLESYISKLSKQYQGS